MNKIIGIDFGTTNSCMAVVEDGNPCIIPNSEGNRITPSMVAFPAADRILIGEAAKRQALLDPANTIFSVKKLLGKKFHQVADFARKVPYSIVETEDQGVAIRVRDTWYSPVEITALILMKMKLDAEDHFGQAVPQAVITIPDRFGLMETAALRQAAQIAGLEVRRLVREPTAACLKYGLAHKTNYVAVFDLGGGSLDVSFLMLEDGVFEVVANAGDLDLGGNDFDYEIVRWLLDEFRRKEGIDLSGDPMVVYRFREAAERAKIELSATEATRIRIPYIAIGSVIKDLETTLTRETLQQLVQPLILRCRDICQLALDKSGFPHYYREEEVPNELIFVGGSTRMPFLQETIGELLRVPVNKSINPDEIVALGGAVQGAVLTGELKDSLLLDACSHNLGILVRENSKEVFFPIIDEDTTIPTKKSEIFLTKEDTAYVDLINRDTLEALRTKGITDPNIIRKSLELQYAYLLPVRTGQNGFQDFKIEIVESDWKTRRTIGVLQLNDIPPNDEEPNAIVIIFDIDANGTINVNAYDRISSVDANMKIEAPGIPKDKLDSLILKFKEDEKEKRRIDYQTRRINDAQRVIANSEKQILTFSEKLSESGKIKILTLLDKFKTAIATSQIDQFEMITQALNGAWQYVSQEIYLYEVEHNLSRNSKVELFISYAHRDETYKDRLIGCLSYLKRLNLINIWNDREIIPGTLWEENGIYKNLDSAQIILLLVSDDFIASDYCYDKEISRALAKRKAKLIPVIIRPTNWRDLPIGRLQALPADGLPVTEWPNEDKAWLNIATGIEKVVREILDPVK